MSGLLRLFISSVQPYASICADGIISAFCNHVLHFHVTILESVNVNQHLDTRAFFLLQFATVYKARDIKTDAVVAVKKVGIRWRPFISQKTQNFFFLLFL